MGHKFGRAILARLCKEVVSEEQRAKMMRLRQLYVNLEGSSFQVDQRDLKTGMDGPGIF